MPVAWGHDKNSTFFFREIVKESNKKRHFKFYSTAKCYGNFYIYLNNIAQSWVYTLYSLLIWQSCEIKKWSIFFLYIYNEKSWLIILFAQLWSSTLLLFNVVTPKQIGYLIGIVNIKMYVDVNVSMKRNR